MWWPAYSWLDFPFQHVSDAIYWYYVIQLGFYISSAMTIFFDVKRSVRVRPTAPAIPRPTHLNSNSSPNPIPNNPSTLYSCTHFGTLASANHVCHFCAICCSTPD